MAESSHSSSAVIPTDCEVFKFMWKIQNFTAWPSSSPTQDLLISPWFNRDHIPGWTVSVQLRFNKCAANRMHIMKISWTNSCEIYKWEIAIMKADGSVHETKSMVDGKTEEKFCVSLDGEPSPLLPNDTLTLKCTVWYKFIKGFFPENIALLSSDMKSLYETKMWSDLTLCTMENEFAVHKFVLWARAPLLAKKLELPSIDVNSPSIVKIDEIDSSTLRALLLFLYCGELKPPIPLDFLGQIAMEYKIESLEKDLAPKAVNSALSKIEFSETKMNWTIPNFMKTGSLTSHFVDLDVVQLTITVPATNPPQIIFKKVKQLRDNINLKVKVKLSTFSGETENLEISCSMESDLLLMNTEKEIIETFNRVETTPVSTRYSSFSEWPQGQFGDDLNLQIDCKVHPRGTVNSYSESTSTKITPSAISLCDLSYDLAMFLHNTDSKTFPSDLMFTGWNRCIRAHRTMVCARSAVFTAMLGGDFTERLDGTVEIDDIEWHTMFDLIKYIYTGRLAPVGYKDVMALYIAADKYRFTYLVNSCSLQLAGMIDKKNVSDVQRHAQLYEDEDLIKAVKSFASSK